MMSLTSFSNSVCSFALAFLVCIAGCAGRRQGDFADAPADRQPLFVAVFPIENLSGTPAPLKDIRDSFISRLKSRGIAVLDDTSLQKFMARHRIRYIGGIDPEMSQALQKETGVGAALFLTMELYEEVPPPRIAFIARLVSTADKQIVLWGDSIGMAGDQSPGLLGLGLVDDPKVITARALNYLVTSLDAYRAGKGRRSPEREKTYTALASYRSPLIGRNLRECDVSFAQRTSAGDEGTSPANLYVMLSTASDKIVSVNYTVSGGTARGGGKDYTLMDGTLTFNPGETVKAIEMELNQGLLYDDDKTVEVSLSKPVNAGLGTPSVNAFT